MVNVKKIRKNILIKSDRKLVQAICELIDNTLRGNIKISNSIYQNLKKYKYTFRKLIKKSKLKTKKKNTYSTRRVPTNPNTFNNRRTIYNY